MVAATVAAQAGASVALIERSDRAGGRLGLQVQSLQGPRSMFRGHSGFAFCRALLNDFEAAGGQLLLNAGVSAVEPSSQESGAFLLTCSAPQGPAALEALSVVLATGSVEPAASFPGADLGGVVLSNDAQRMVNVEGRLPGRRVLMVGSDNAGLFSSRRTSWTPAPRSWRWSTRLRRSSDARSTPRPCEPKVSRS